MKEASAAHFLSLFFYFLFSFAFYVSLVRKLSVNLFPRVCAPSRRIAKAMNHLLHAVNLFAVSA